MKDLDFDELDKAVNSLMTNVPKTSEPPRGEKTEKTLNITPTLDDTVTPPSFDKLGAATAQTTGTPSVPRATSSSVATPQPAASPAPPASRRGGRFMDLVHPSGDMKKPTTTIPTRPPSRQGVSIEPRSTAIQPEAPQPVSTSVSSGSPLTTSSASAVSPRSVETVAEKTPPVSEWPDPLEMTNFKTDEPKKEQPQVSLPIEPKKTTSDDLSTEPEAPKEGSGSESEQAPLTSPFLPGAKVEKRPLGNGMSPLEEPSRAPATDAELSKTVDDPNAQLPALPADVAPMLPEELQGDLMAVEADTHMGVPKTDESHPLEEKPEEKPVKPEAEAKPKEPMSTPKPAATEEAPAGPTSIPQQYREEPSTGDKESGAIYDTDSYHQPLAHPAKKKSGWLWVLWIVIILIVGAGGGATLYFLGIV